MAAISVTPPPARCSCSSITTAVNLPGGSSRFWFKTQGVGEFLPSMRAAIILHWVHPSRDPTKILNFRHPHFCLQNFPIRFKSRSPFRDHSATTTNLWDRSKKGERPRSTSISAKSACVPTATRSGCATSPSPAASGAWNPGCLSRHRPASSVFSPLLPPLDWLVA